MGFGVALLNFTVHNGSDCWRGGGSKCQKCNYVIYGWLFGTSPPPQQASCQLFVQVGKSFGN